jgi:hypothetical protein
MASEGELPRGRSGSRTHRTATAGEFVKRAGGRSRRRKHQPTTDKQTESSYVFGPPSHAKVRRRPYLLPPPRAANLRSNPWRADFTPPKQSERNRAESVPRSRADSPRARIGARTSVRSSPVTATERNKLRAPTGRIQPPQPIGAQTLVRTNPVTAAERNKFRACAEQNHLRAPVPPGKAAELHDTAPAPGCTVAGVLVVPALAGCQVTDRLKPARPTARQKRAPGSRA